MNALGLAYSSDDSDAESAKSNVSIDSKSSSGMSHNSVTKANDGEVLTRSRNNSFEGETNVKSSQDVGNLQDFEMEDTPLTIKPTTKPKSIKPVIPEKFHNAQEFASFIRLHKHADLADLLPPEPNTDELQMHSNLQARISAMVDKKNQGYNFMQAIETKKSYCNPHIYEKLVQTHGIRESGTNFTEDIYNPYAFNSTCYYDKLREEQANYMDELSKKQTREKFIKAEQTMDKKDASKKKSKWGN